MTPESPAARRKRGLETLAAVPPGRGYTVRSVYERDGKLLEFLDARGIRPGAHGRLLDRNYDQTLTLETEAGSVPLGSAAAEKVWVSLEKDGRRPTPPAKRA
jgi:DtxR family Mn-dependent transcriptional regulator